MTSAAKKYFDVLSYVKTSKALGVKEDLAEYQARQLAEIIDIASANTQEEFTVRELATKTDIHELRAETKTDIHELRTDVNGLKDTTKDLVDRIGNLRYDTIKFVVWTGVSIVVFIGTMMAKGFHWL